MNEIDCKFLFQSLPEQHLLMSPEFIMLTATKKYLEITHTTMEQIKNQYVFDVFPENEETKKAHGSQTLSHSLEAVVRTKQPHVMPTLRYDIVLPENPNKFVTRWWRVTNSPILNEKGELAYILNSVDDITHMIDVLESAQDFMREHQDKD